MKCCIKDLAIVLWHMVQTCLPVSDATVIRQASSGESNLFVKGDFGVSGRSFLRFFKKKGMPYIIVTSQRGSLAVMNRTIFELKQTNIVKEGFFKPKEALPAPEGAFKFPAFTVVDGDAGTKQRSRITLVDATDLANPKWHEIADEEDFEFNHPVWIDDGFIISKTGDEKSELVYLKSKTGAEKTEPWEKNTVGDVDVLKNNKITQMLLFKNIWNSFDAVYAIGNDKDLIIMWTEAEADKPGDWLKTEEFKAKIISSFNGLAYIKLVDINLDGRLDLLLAVGSSYWQVSTYVIPNSEDFKNPNKYELFALVVHQKPDVDFCPNIVKTFIPFNSYVGKPWLLMGGHTCQSAFYAVPQNQDPQNWNYTSYSIVVDDKPNVRYSGLEAADMDEDGIVELFVVLEENDIVRAFSFKEQFLKLSTALTTKPAARPTLLRVARGSSINISLTLVICSATTYLFFRNGTY